ncbi:hypothetical protein Btru_044178 [Bulinus truncatus]|nr:hypothetical protein Btru_044178 [Bulinus truncatus]
MAEGIQCFTSGNATCFNRTLPSMTTEGDNMKPIYFNDFPLFCFHGSLEFIKLYEIFFCYVNPPLAILGMAVNGLSMAILRRSGLGKPANILLLALVIADSMNMVTSISVADKLRMFGPVKSKPGYCTWEYDDANGFIFFTYQSMFAIGQWGRFVNSNIPVLITVERLLAVYFPVTFKKVVTFRSAIAACVSAYMLWLPYTVFQSYYRQMATVQHPNGKYVSFSTSTEFLRKNFAVIFTFAVTGLEALLSWLPISFVCIGCLFIAIKVKVSIARRRKLSKLKEKQRWSPRTTRTLLTTCLIFAITHTVTALITLRKCGRYL